MTKRTRTGLALAAATVTLLLAGAGWWSLSTVPKGTLPPGPADAIVVFGSPVDITGKLLPMQVWRVDEAVAEYRRGVAPYLVFAGGGAANRFVESDFMAREAIRQGVPPEAILREGYSTTTLQNIRNVTPLLRAHGFQRIELLSSADHLPRIAVLMRAEPFTWRLHAAPTPGRTRLSLASAYAEEAVAILILRTFGTAAEPVIHAIATCEHGLVFAPKWVIFHIKRALGK